MCLSACNDMGIAVILVMICSLNLLLVEANAKETLRLAMLFSQKGVIDFSGMIPAIDIALETIDRDETLPFNFTYVHNDSMVSSYVYVYYSV